MRLFPDASSRLTAVLFGIVIGAASLQGQDRLPASVPGLCRVGFTTKVIKVSVRDAAGALLQGAQPGIAVLKSARWSPNDAERDGASEFEVFLCVGRLLDGHALAGVVGIGNRNGAFLPAAEQALARAVAMGLPVVKVSVSGALETNSENLFIEAGALSADEARATLAECLVTLGALPPARNPLAPSRAELQAIHAKLDRYQRIFNAKSGSDVRVAVR